MRALYIWVGMVWLGMGLGGCVGSVHPLYERNEDILDPTPYLGVWGNERWFMKAELIEAQTKALFLVTVLEFPSFHHDPTRYPTPPYTVNVLVGALVAIEGETYLDLTTPCEATMASPEVGPSTALHLLPVHTFHKITLEKDEFCLQGMNGDRVKEVLEKEPALLAHFVSNQDKDELKTKRLQTVVLTAESAALREFLRQHGKDDIWMEKEKYCKFTRGDALKFAEEYRKVERRWEASKKARDAEAAPPTGRGGGKGE